MDLGLKGRTAIVSGASAGLGLATAEALAAEGANVTMFARRRDVLQREADRIGALAVRGDVTNPRDLEAVVRQTVTAFGGIDILVWNGGGPPPGPAIGITPESLEEAVELLFFPALRLVDFCLPYLDPEPGRPHPHLHLGRRQGADRPSRAEQRRAAGHPRLGEDSLP